MNILIKIKIDSTMKGFKNLLNRLLIFKGGIQPIILNRLPDHASSKSDASHSLFRIIGMVWESEGDPQYFLAAPPIEPASNGNCTFIST